MPPLTRSAARAASAGTDVTGVQALRLPVSNRGKVVWEHRETDLYTGKGRDETPDAQVDHVLEVQLAEYAFVRAYGAAGARAGSMAATQAHEQIADVLNGVANLNVTTRAINCAKRGPFTRALNRLNSDSLRDFTLEQLARTGSTTKPLVDDGTWARIEGAIVNAYDVTEETLNARTALPAAAELTAHTLEELASVLGRLGVHNH